MNEQAQARPEETAQALLEDLRSGRARVIYEDAEGCHSRVYGAATVAAAAGRLVPAVTPEAVKATRLYKALDAIARSNEKYVVAYIDLPDGTRMVPSTVLDETGCTERVGRASGASDVELSAQGRTIHAALAAGEPGEPTADELLDALEYLFDAGFMRRTRSGNVIVEYDKSGVIIAACDGTLRDLARAIIAQRGGEPTTDDASRTAESE